MNMDGKQRHRSLFARCIRYAGCAAGSPPAGRLHRTGLVCALLLFGAPHAVHAASFQGAVTDERGAPLPKVPICLSDLEEGRGCIKVQSTDRRGNYRFNGVKDGVSYRVSVFQDDSAAGRKFERYRTYVWAPGHQLAQPALKNETLNLAPFVGKFNFSNFQRGLVLTATDFQELASIDLQGAYVVLKVFIPPRDPADTPETIYLGQVTDPAKLHIVASVPLATSSLAYQIYSESLSLDGIISLTSP